MFSPPHRWSGRLFFLHLVIFFEIAILVGSILYSGPGLRGLIFDSLFVGFVAFCAYLARSRFRLAGILFAIPNLGLAAVMIGMLWYFEDFDKVDQVVVLVLVCLLFSGVAGAVLAILGPLRAKPDGNHNAT